jgi:hypothetical protein
MVFLGCYNTPVAGLGWQAIQSQPKENPVHAVNIKSTNLETTMLSQGKTGTGQRIEHPLLANSR